MSDPPSRLASGATTHVVQQGECLASIALDAGVRWQTLWDHPRNAELRRLRKDPSVLLPGDQVLIPEQPFRSEACQTGSSYRFVCKGTIQRLQLIMLTEDGQPRRGIKYTLSIDGVETSGTTDADGTIACSIRANARQGTLVLHEPNQDEPYELLLGHLDPLSVTSGAQARLNNLGFRCGEVDGVIGPRTRHAIRCFQASRSLVVTGELDEATRNALAEAHGS